MDDLERAMPTPSGLSRGRFFLVCCSATEASVTEGRPTAGLARATEPNASTKSAGHELIRVNVGRPPRRGTSVETNWAWRGCNGVADRLSMCAWTAAAKSGYC